MKYLIGILLNIGFFFILKEYALLCERIYVSHNNEILKGAGINFYSIIFSLFVLAILLSVNLTSLKWRGNYIIVITIALIGLGINLLMTNYIYSNYSIYGLIKNNVYLGYNLLFQIPTLVLTPILIINVAKYLNVDQLIKTLQFFDNTAIDYRFKRFLAYIFDLVITLILLLFVVKFGVFPHSDIFPFLITHFLYKFTIEASAYTSFGKILFGLRIVSSKNTSPKTYQVLIRNFCRIIPFYGLPILWNSVPIHDRISKTRIVDC